MGRMKSLIKDAPLPHAGFVHLRVHTAYSLSEGAIPVKNLLGLCQDNGMPAVAITDTNNMFGSLEMSLSFPGGGVQPIMGCQIAVTHMGTVDRSGRKPEPDPVVLLAQNEEGYYNLLKLTSHAFLKTEAGDSVQVPMAFLATHAAGLICLTGGAGGPIGRLIANEQLEEAKEYLLTLKEMFPDRLYVELQRHDLEIEQQTEPAMLDFAYELDIPLVATN
ncbi:MAG: PHP domain-containing protein, partial [Sneathiella sp.]|nr:PHP domain-containing protein [Sneathiella sp.]